MSFGARKLTARRREGERKIYLVFYYRYLVKESEYMGREVVEPRERERCSQEVVKKMGQSALFHFVSFLFIVLCTPSIRCYCVKGVIQKEKVSILLTA